MIMIAPTILPGRAFQNTAATSDLILGWRASDLALDAYTGQSATFARASVGGLVQGTGIRQWLDTDEQRRLVGPHPDGTPRWEMVLNENGVYVPALRLEGARTNAWTYSKALDNVAWTKTRCSVSADAVVAPDGQTTADKIVEDGLTDTHYYLRAATITADTDQTASVYIKAAERTRGEFYCSSGANIFGVLYNLTAETLTDKTGGAGANTASTITDVGGGWYRISITGSVMAGSTSMSLTHALSDASGNVYYAGDGASGSYVWGNQLEIDQPFASTYVPTLGATVTRAAESLSWPFALKPTAMTVYCRKVESGSRLVDNARILQIGAANDSGARILVRSQAGVERYQATYNNGATGGTVSIASGTISQGDELEFLLTMTAAGVAQLSQSINGGAEVTSSALSALALPSAWGGQLLWLNSVGATSVGFGGYRALKVARGVRTMDFMRSAY